MKSIRIPYSFSGGKTSATTVTTTIVEQKIVDVLTTGKFERLLRHRYGSGIRQLLFEPVDDLTLSDFIVEARQDVAENISRVDIMDIRLSSTNSIAAYGNQDTTIGVTVIYRLPLGSPQIVRFKIAVPGNLTEDSEI
jgi:phage baseplate assembly protein W